MDFPSVDRARAEWEKQKGNRFSVPLSEEQLGKKGLMQRLASSTAVKALLVAVPLIGVAASMVPSVGDYNYDIAQVEATTVFIREHVVSSEKTGFLTEVRSVNVQRIDITGTQARYNVSQVDKSYIAGLQFSSKEAFNVTLTPENLQQRYVGANADMFREMQENYREIVEVQKQADAREMDAFNAKFGSMDDALKLVQRQFYEGTFKVAYSFKEAAESKARPPAGETYAPAGLKIISYTEYYSR